jgi:hypothetical protein
MIEVHNAAGTYANDCATCHDTAVDGALVNGTVGNATLNSGNGGECIICHSDFSGGHVTHSATTHAITQDSTDLSGTKLCNECHGVGGTSNTTKFNNAWDHVSGDDIYALHQGGCVQCHDSTRTNITDPNTIRTYASVAEVIQNVATPYCLDCHLDRASGHGVHAEGDGTLGVVTVAPNDTPCGGCHATASGSSAPKGEVTAGIHSDNCSLCHAGGVAGADPPAGIIVDDAVTVWNGSAWLTANQPHDCVECHVDYFGDNTGGHTHVHEQLLRPDYRHLQY